jgi:hypothetical protein
MPDARAIDEVITELDGPRMGSPDTVFANRYLDALATWQAGGAPSKCWK